MIKVEAAETIRWKAGDALAVLWPPSPTKLELSSEAESVWQRLWTEPKPEGLDEGFVVPLPSGGGPEFLIVLDPSAIKRQSSEERIRMSAGRALRQAEKVKAKRLVVLTSGVGGVLPAILVAEGLRVAAYRFTKYKSKASPSSLSSAVLAVPKGEAAKLREPLRVTTVLHDSLDLTRDLANELPSVLVPKALADAGKSAAEKAGLEVEVWDEKTLAKQRCNGVLTVGQGSSHPPRMLIMRHRPKGKSKSGVHLALVGKGVTFDTGGISIKPAGDMWKMKADMAGGAAVIGAMRAIALLGLPITVTGIVPMAQNAVDARSVLPGDVIVGRNGKTVHVDNTDAEGRLLLMDALVQAQEEGATHCVDVATLTGAASRALGPAVSAVFANEDEMADLVVDSGRKIGESYWRLPLVDEYLEMIQTEVADLNNAGNSPYAGAITAALFLREFVAPGMHWAHCDIAGTALTAKPWRHYRAGATGVAMRMLAGLAMNLAKK